MKKNNFTVLIVFLILSLTTICNAQYKLNIGNLWLYRSYSQEWKISIIDTVTLFDSLLYYETDWNSHWINKTEQNYINCDNTVRYFIRKKDDGLFERVITYPNSGIEVRPFTYMENAKLGDKWVYEINYSNDETEVDTMWAEVEEVYDGLQFEKFITIKKIHYYSDHPQVALDYYKYFCEEFGELAEEGYLYIDVLIGCYIDGVVYGDTNFTINSITEGENQIISHQLEQNYPNPFNSNTIITYRISTPSFVNLSIYDMTGQLVEILEEGNKSANTYRVNWDASRFTSGVYFIRCSAGNYQSVRKMLLAK